MEMVIEMSRKVPIVVPKVDFLSTFGTSIGTFCRIVVAFVTSIVLAS